MPKTNKKRSTRSGVFSFVRALVRIKSIKKTAEENYEIVSCQRILKLSESEINILVSQGVVSRKGKVIFVNSETKNWLKRSMAGGADQYLDQHRKTVSTAGLAKTNMSEGPLSRLNISIAGKSPFLLSHHIEAAKRFAHLVERAQLRARTTMNYGDTISAAAKSNSAANIDIGDMAMDARQEVKEIMSNLPPDCAGIILDVCGMEKGLQLVERERGWPRRSAKLVLRIGLEQLAQNYGLSATATGHVSHRLNGWLGEGSRPTSI